MVVGVNNTRSPVKLSEDDEPLRYTKCARKSGQAQLQTLFQCDGEPVGRYVIVLLIDKSAVLRLCEVEVYGFTPPRK